MFLRCFFYFISSQHLEDIFFSDSSSPNPIMDYGKYYLTFHLYLKIKMKKNLEKKTQQLI